MKKIQYLSLNAELFKNKIVLDLACHSGQSTKVIHELGAKHVYAVDVRPELINKAQQELAVSNVEFIVGDITDYQLLPSLVTNSNIITCFGVLYHLFDHFRFFSHILKSNIEYVLFETEFGTESLNPTMDWGFEVTDNILHGYHENLKIIPNGTPNLAWILQASDVFGFKCDWIKFYGNKKSKHRKQITSEEYLTIAGPNWPSYFEIISDNPIPDFVESEISQYLHIFTSKRMIIRLYNSKSVNSNPLTLQDIYKWS